MGQFLNFKYLIYSLARKLNSLCTFPSCFIVLKQKLAIDKLLVMVEIRSQ